MLLLETSGWQLGRTSKQLSGPVTKHRQGGHDSIAALASQEPCQFGVAADRGREAGRKAVQTLIRHALHTSLLRFEIPYVYILTHHADLGQRGVAGRAQ